MDVVDILREKSYLALSFELNVSQFIERRLYTIYSTLIDKCQTSETRMYRITNDSTNTASESTVGCFRVYVTVR